MEELARKYFRAENFLYLGRGINYPIALEGALKLKEISYIHAEGYPAGEMKHGPIALIDREMPVVAIATGNDVVFEKVKSNLQEVKARDGVVIALTDRDPEELGGVCDEVIEVPSVSPLLQPIVNVIPLQLLAYFTGVRRGADVDQPRNLAKSVTVEYVEVYRQRRLAFQEEERRLARISVRFSIVRGVLFAGFLAGLFAILLQAGSPPPWTWAAAAGFLAAFVFILPYHDRAIQRQRQAAMLVRINEEALRRIERDWDAFPLPSSALSEADRPLARDLNLFGRASLFHLLGTANTPPGKAALAGWLLRPAPPDEIAARQAAVAELAPELDLRQRLEQRARPLGQVSPDIEPFLRWAEGRPWLLERPWLVWLTPRPRAPHAARPGRLLRRGPAGLAGSCSRSR